MFCFGTSQLLNIVLFFMKGYFITYFLVQRFLKPAFKPAPYNGFSCRDFLNSVPRFFNSMFVGVLYSLSLVRVFF